MSTSDVSAALEALEALAASSATSSSGPLSTLLDNHFAVARERLLAGAPPKHVISELQNNVTRAKKDVEKGLKAWYAGLNNVGKSIEKAFPPNLAAISSAYDDPPLFSDPVAAEALDRVILESLGRRGLWDAVSAFEEETGLMYDSEKRVLSEQLSQILSDIEAGDLSSAIAWCNDHKSFYATTPHSSSSLPYHLHEAMFRSFDRPLDAILYARQAGMHEYLGTQPIGPMLTSCLFKNPSNTKSPYHDEPPPLAKMFRDDFCRFHGWAREEPLEVVANLGSRGGALNAIEKARRVMGERLGNVRTWPELPMEVPLPASRRYHSVFVCPVSKEQATDSNPPKMLACGHVIAQDSLNRLLKGGRRAAKCPYCPMETSQTNSQRLYF